MNLRWRRLLKLKRKINKLFQDYHWLLSLFFFFTPPLFLATKVAISFVYYRQKLSNALKSLKSKRSFQESTSRASEWVPFSTSYLPLALAHARNSRVINHGTEQVNRKCLLILRKSIDFMTRIKTPIFSFWSSSMAAQLNRHVIINFFKKFLYITKNYAIRSRIRKDKMAGIYKGKMGCSENI